MWAVELPGFVWHTVVSFADDTALFEIKPGPYTALADKDFAPWAPSEDCPDAQALIETWRRHVERLPSLDARPPA